YSDMARGLARVLGFDLRVNFAEPYSACSLREFWQRWHISLSEWLRDRVYLPLGGNRRGLPRTLCHLIVTMLAGGLWHGAAWHFVAWGGWHGIGLAGRVLWNRAGIPLPRIAGWMLTLAFVGASWLLFRAPDLETAGAMTRALGDLSAPVWLGSAGIQLAWFGLPAGFLDWTARRHGFAKWGAALPATPKLLLQGALLFASLRYWRTDGAAFLYFQF
ncbi:MAG: MBOAT family protein, partial [Verrucomicrobiae bacterium]|nr:MBOAT family protein [Verrucomicrobiae bacterium]